MKDRLPAAFAILVSVFALHLALLYFRGAAAAGALSAALLALILFTASCCGRILLRFFRIRGISESEKTLIGATLGLGLLSQAIFLLGLAGLLKAWAVSALLGIFWVIGFTEMRDLLRSLGANRNILRDRPLLSGSVLIFLGVLFWLTWVPPHQYDSLVYHLPLADAYAREGSIHLVDHLLYTHFPQNAEMFFTLAILLGSDILAQMFSWLGVFLSVWWLFEMAKREVAMTVVLGACFLVVTHTAVMLLAPTTYVECLVMLWITAAVLCALRWRMATDEEHSARGWLALAGVFAGLGVGTKYNAGIAPAVIGLYLLGRWLRMRPWSQGGSYVHDRLKDGAVFAAAAALAGAPWLLKNAAMIGNPFFPFFYKLLPSNGIPWGVNSAARYFEMLTQYGHTRGGFFADLLSFPYLAATGSMRFGGGADVLGNLGWGLLFIAVPAAVWAAWKVRYLRWVLAYCAAHLAAWFATGVVLRFLVVLVPLLSLLAAHGIHKIWGKLGDAGKWCLGIGVGVLLWTNLALFLFVHAVVGSLPVLTGAESRHKYLSKMLDYYPCAAYARENLDDNDKILIVGEQRGYYVKQDHAATTVMAPNRFVQVANESADAADLNRRLREGEGFSHILFVPREAARLGEGYGVFHFTDKGFKIWSDLEDGFVETAFESPGRCVLYRLNG